MAVASIDARLTWSPLFPIRSPTIERAPSYFTSSINSTISCATSFSYRLNSSLVELQEFGVRKMAGTASDGAGAGSSMESLSSVQSIQSGEALAEWRSCEQVENGTPSTSPPYWDIDDSDDDGGPKPSDLYGRYTWKIEKFSTINKRELKSNPFEVGGYKWYILIYPQGCDVCNHLSLFLCVANHDKLLPGWSHFAQFTIAVVNKDPKKSKYSDTLHRFWKKEHDWGWKKFMELSKVSDGFIDADTLIIKAQVQVIRERGDHPFRCLDCQYRRELVRVYLTNVEQICRRFVDDRRGKLGKLLEDKARWSSFCAFWLGIDQSARRRMSREKMDLILKVIVKHFFIEKEVTSTLVMDSLYSGLKALEAQSKCIKGKEKLLECEDTPAPVVRVEKDMFVLVDDVLLLLERATMEPLPPKDEKGPQNRTKDGSAGEDFNKDSIERDERRLTELGRRTVEIFVLTHIFSSKIEAAYQEAVALKRQEELIREEKAESEQKAKRGIADKEKKGKKKQGKQKRNNRKAKDKIKDEKPDLGSEDQQLHGEVMDSPENQIILDKDDALEVEDGSDESDVVECSADIVQPDLEDRDPSAVNWDTDTSEVNLPAEISSSAVGNGMSTVLNGGDRRSSSIMDDSSSTCSTDSAPSVAMNGSYRSNSYSDTNKIQRSPTRGKNQRAKGTLQEATSANDAQTLTSEPVTVSGRPLRTQDRATEPSKSEPVLQEPIKKPDQTIIKKGEEAVLLPSKLSYKTHPDSEKQPKEKPSVEPCSLQSSSRNTVPSVQTKSEPKKTHVLEFTPVRKTAVHSVRQTEKVAPVINVSQPVSILKPDPVKAPSPKPAEKASVKQAPTMPRPSSAPVIPVLKPVASPVGFIAQAVQTAPSLSRSASTTAWLNRDPSPINNNFVTQSYKNAIMGNTVASSSSSSSHPPQQSSNSALNQSPSPSPSASPSPSFSQRSTLVPGPFFVPQAAERAELNSINPGVSYSTAARDARHHWLDSPQRQATGRSLSFDPSSMLNEIQNASLYNRSLSTGNHELFRSDFSVSTSGRQAATQGGLLADEFPHLDIINDLLDDEQGHGNAPRRPYRQFGYPNELSMSGDMGSGRLDRDRIYHEDTFQPDYASPGSHYDTLPEYIPQSNLMPYMNGQIPNQWQQAGNDLSMLTMRNSGNGDGYPYGIPDYSNMLNGYTMFRPSNGH
ncbi:hypothetical protein V2J09_023190 [Rumex salicifolius]